MTPNTPASGYGSVIVESGAVLQSPTNSDHVGGKVALIGQTVINEGTIETPDGQAILAAGLQVGISQHVLESDHTTSDSSIRGLDVYVGAVDSANAQSGFGDQWRMAR